MPQNGVPYKSLHLKRKDGIIFCGSINFFQKNFFKSFGNSHFQRKIIKLNITVPKCFYYLEKFFNIFISYIIVFEIQKILLRYVLLIHSHQGILRDDFSLQRYTIQICTMYISTQKNIQLQRYQKTCTHAQYICTTTFV